MHVRVWPGAAFVMSCRRLLAPVQAAAARFPSVHAAACGGMFRGRSGRFRWSAVVLQPVCVDEKQVF